MGLNQYKIELPKDKGEEVKVFDEKTHEEKGSIDRKEGIEKGALLEAVQLWLINPRTNKVLMQRRSPNKENDPNMIDISAAGHVYSNEIPEQAVLRETFEEIQALPTEIYNTLTKLMQIEVDLRKVGRKGRYITHEYIAFLDKPLEYFKRQESEVAELFWMDYEEVKKMIREKNSDMRIPYNEDTERLIKKIDEVVYEKQQENKKDIIR